MPSSGPYRTFDDVVEGLGTLERRFREQHDRRCIFLTLYSVVSAAARERVAGGLFEDNEWVGRYAVAFADMYRQALEQYETGWLTKVPSAWRLCFDFAKAHNGLVLQDLLLAVNAHINHDLAFALVTASIDPDRASRHRDHARVNEIFASVLQTATERVAALYAPGLRNLDDCAGQIDELVSLFSIDRARESAWEAAVAMANARTDLERQLTSRLVSSRATVLARLIRAPSLKPAFVRACRQLEQESNWLSLVPPLV